MQVLGHGCFSIVYRCNDTVVKKYNVRNKVAYREASLLSMMHDRFNDVKYFKIPEVVSYDDDTLVIRPVCVAWQPTERRVQALIKGLERLHSIGYVHRDICPENVLLEHSTDTTVLIDFNTVIPVDQFVDFQGTIRHASDRVLQHVHRKPSEGPVPVHTPIVYTPADDLVSASRTIYHILENDRFPLVCGCSNDDVITYWSQILHNNREWSEINDCAVQCDYSAVSSLLCNVISHR